MNKEINLWKEKTKGLFHIVEWTRFWYYITNLQESEAYYYGQYKDYKSRNEKAIEFVEQNLEGIGYVEVCDLLNILQGEDKDE